MSFQIGNIKINNKLILAPMAGVSNSPFRIIARRYGAGLMFSEMISDKALYQKNERTLNMLRATDEEKPFAQQIFGSDLSTMLEAAKFIDQHSNCDIIDINMGCPVPKVAIKSQAGSALLKNPLLIYEIVKKIVENVSKPVTVKIRSGWDNNSINAIEVSQLIEKAGASAITLHARTRQQGYGGNADWDLIRQVKQAVSIPVIGNGDVSNGEEAKRMLDETGCDAVMIGRAALGNPWIFEQINNYLNDEEIREVSHDEVYQLIILHLDYLSEMWGEKNAILEMRSHGPWYLKGLPNAKETRRKLVKATTRTEFIMILNQFFQDLKLDNNLV